MHLGHAAQPEITAAAVELLTDFRLRPAVEEKAEMFGCLEAVFDLTIIDAVRLLQQKELYIPCFGGESPWFHSRTATHLLRELGRKSSAVSSSAAGGCLATCFELCKLGHLRSVTTNVRELRELPWTVDSARPYRGNQLEGTQYLAAGWIDGCDSDG